MVEDVALIAGGGEMPVTAWGRNLARSSPGTEALPSGHCLAIAVSFALVRKDFGSLARPKAAAWAPGPAMFARCGLVWT